MDYKDSACGTPWLHQECRSINSRWLVECLDWMNPLCYCRVHGDRKNPDMAPYGRTDGASTLEEIQRTSS
jgi:hypothetical protein